MNPNYLAVIEALSKLPATTVAPSLAPPTRRPDSFAPPLSLGTPMPDAPPMAPSMPIDQNIVNRYLALLGPAPVAPVQTQPGKLERLALALQGFSAGTQGRAPEFLASVRAERERPQREYEAQKAEYDQRRLQLGLRGMEAAQSAEEKRQARQQAEADRQFEIEVQNRARQAGLEDQMAIEKFRDALLTERQRKDDERAQAAAEAEAQAKMERDIRAQADRLFDDFKGNQGGGISRAQAIRFAQYEITGLPLSPLDQKAYNRVVAPVKAGQPTEGAREKLARFETLKGQLGAARARGDVNAEAAILKRLDEMAARMPSFIETGYDKTGMWPYAKVRGTNPQPQGQAQGQAQTESPNRAQSRARLVANGYSNDEATRELDRLGIK